MRSIALGSMGIVPTSKRPTCLQAASSPLSADEFCLQVTSERADLFKIRSTIQDGDPASLVRSGATGSLVSATFTSMQNGLKTIFVGSFVCVVGGCQQF